MCTGRHNIIENVENGEHANLTCQILIASMTEERNLQKKLE